MSNKEAKAKAQSGGGWATVGSQDMANRYALTKYDLRYGRRWCGRCRRIDETARTRATHKLMANGVCLGEACELHAAAWVRDPNT